MPKISHGRTFLIERPAYVKLDTYYGKGPARYPHVIVQLFAGDTWGVGEASPLGENFGERADGVQLVIEAAFLPLLIGRDPVELAGIHAAMDGVLPYNPSAKAAVGGALLDLAGKLMGIPSCHLLGGPCAPQLPFTRPIGIMETKEAVTTAKELVATGVGTLKMKIGSGDPATDIERVQAVREAAGSRVKIRIDANQGLDFPSAHRMLMALRGSDILYIEQPLPAWDVEGAAALRRETGCRLATDEGVTSLHDAVRLIHKRAADVFILKLVKMGGAWRARQIAALAEAYGVQCVVVSTFDTQVGGSMCVQLARSIPNAPYAHELTVFPTQPDLAKTCHRVEAGVVIPGDEPGIGVTSIVELSEVLTG